MTAITDFSTDVALVRLLIGDISTVEKIFEDSAIEAFLSISQGSVKRAAASALLVIAVNEVLVQKRIRLLDLSTDGPSEAAALRELAAELRREGEEEAAAGSIMYLDVPSVDRFDRRTNEQWARLQR